jgi:hypothetical protein
MKPEKKKKSKSEPTGLTIAVYYSVKKPEQVADFKAIHDEAESCGFSPTDYLRRLIRIGREEAKKDIRRLFMKVA